MRNFDTEWLRYQPTRTELRAFRRNARDGGVPSADGAAPSVRGGCTTALMVPFSLAVVVFSLVGFGEDGITGLTIGLAVFALFMVLGTVLIVGRVRIPRFGPRLWRDRLRLARLADANDCTYTPFAESSHGAVGLLLELSDQIYDVVTTRESPRISLGNLAYKQETSRGGAIDHRWGFVSVQLERTFPHMILDSRTNNGLNGEVFPNPYRGGALQLEGDFPRHFTLFCPAGYGADIRYVLTPDLMTDLIDDGAGFDVEVIDDRIIFYKPLGLALGREREWQLVNRLLQRVAADMARRAGRYSDARTVDGRVAPGGVRMQKVNVLPWMIGTALVLIVGAVLTQVFQ
ncbi:hypothetical protein [Paramicrobacterium chengjingii]|uniref:hypothetical protein n=1 Tax=Paramicrobacterium chengjingii TaxID=2769067 RepID=UPI0014208869|nr:hypothetical protein [Microbacterium chengjingii]